MAKRKLKKSTRAKTCRTGKSSRASRTTNRKSMIGKPSNPFYIDDVRTLL